MERRKFIRLVGGGLAGAALVGCSNEPPPVAIAAWRGPEPQEELRRWALSYAILAPNSHNRQPWLVDLRRPNEITLHVDRERLLPETDPWFRQIVVSQGTFLELLVMALMERGAAPTVDLFPEGEFGPRSLDARPVATVRWQAGAPAPTRDPLFAQILRRQTAKVAYDPKQTVSEEVLGALSQAIPSGAPSHLRFGATAQRERVEVLQKLAVDAARVEVSTPRTVMESNRLTRVGPEEIERHRDGVTLNGAMPRLAVALGLFDRSVAPEPGSSAFEQVLESYRVQAMSAAAFSWITTAAAPGSTRSAEVWAGRSFVRQQLIAARLGVQVHPMSQAPQEFAEMQPFYKELHRLLADGPDSGQTVQMLCRVGYCPVQPKSPRRSLDTMLMA